ncbi:hypothetical protein TNCV_765871 [Trichonephila clavipes]|nr:hypothetical protein TNCV_765871 [Trichonephila clavipes]
MIPNLHNHVLLLELVLAPKNPRGLLYENAMKAPSQASPSSSEWIRNAFLSGKNCVKSQEDKSELYCGHSNIFLRNFFKIFWDSREMIGPSLSWRSGIVSHPSRKPIVRTKQCSP